MGAHKSKFTLRIDSELLMKFRYVAEYNGQSANKELGELVSERVDDFEKTVEKVPLDWLRENRQAK